MQEWDDQAIVLRLGQFKESDIWLRVLFENHGLQTVFAFGGARSRRRFCGCLDRLNILNCHVRESRGGTYLCLQEAELLEGTRTLRHNWKLGGLAANCMSFVEAMTIDAESAPDIFAVLLSLRSWLENLSFAPAWLPYFFRLRIAAGLGFAPDFETCGKCGRPLSGGVFFPPHGRTYCESCARDSKLDSRILPASAASFSCLAEVQRTLPRSWATIRLANSEARDVSRIADAFIQFHLGYSWEGGGFRRLREA